MKRHRATPPTMMFSIGAGVLEFFAKAYVERAEQEEGERDADVDEVIHSEVSLVLVITMPASVLVHS